MEFLPIWTNEFLIANRYDCSPFLKHVDIKLCKPKQGLYNSSPIFFILSSLAYTGIKVIPKISLDKLSSYFFKNSLIVFLELSTASSSLAFVYTITIGSFFPSYFFLISKIIFNSSSKNLLEVVQYIIQWICSLGSLLSNFFTISSKVSFSTTSNSWPFPISVPIVSSRLTKGTNFDSYFWFSRVHLVPNPSFATFSPNISLINVLLPTPLVPMTIKFIFCNSFWFTFDLTIFKNFIFIFCIIFSYSNNLSNNKFNSSFKLLILTLISGSSNEFIHLSCSSSNLLNISNMLSVNSLSKEALHFSIASFSFSICLNFSSLSCLSFSNNCFSLSNCLLLSSSILFLSCCCNSYICCS